MENFGRMAPRERERMSSSVIVYNKRESVCADNDGFAPVLLFKFGTIRNRIAVASE
jgi:hypothetical protein